MPLPANPDVIEMPPEVLAQISQPIPAAPGDVPIAGMPAVVVVPPPAPPPRPAGPTERPRIQLPKKPNFSHEGKVDEVYGWRILKQGREKNGLERLLLAGEFNGGVVLNSQTRFRDRGNEWKLTEAMTFIPCAKIEDIDGVPMIVKGSDLEARAGTTAPLTSNKAEQPRKPIR